MFNPWSNPESASKILFMLLFILWFMLVNILIMKATSFLRGVKMLLGHCGVLSINNFNMAPWWQGKKVEDISGDAFVRKPEVFKMIRLMSMFNGKGNYNSRWHSLISVYLSISTMSYSDSYILWLTQLFNADAQYFSVPHPFHSDSSGVQWWAQYAPTPWFLHFMFLTTSTCFNIAHMHSQADRQIDVLPCAANVQSHDVTCALYVYMS